MALRWATPVALRGLVAIAAALAGCAEDPIATGADVAAASMADEGGDLPVGESAWTRLEIQDEMNPWAFATCDTAGIRSLGSDLDAAELLEGDAVRATLADCVLGPGSECPNDLSDPREAEGPPDALEIYQGQVALNGGVLRCVWSGGEALAPGLAVRVYEISGADTFERFRIRACRGSGEECTRWSEHRVGKERFRAEELF